MARETQAFNYHVCHRAASILELIVMREEVERQCRGLCVLERMTPSSIISHTHLHRGRSVAAAWRRCNPALEAEETLIPLHATPYSVQAPVTSMIALSGQVRTRLFSVRDNSSFITSYPSGSQSEPPWRLHGTMLACRWSETTAVSAGAGRRGLIQGVCSSLPAAPLPPSLFARLTRTEYRFWIVRWLANGDILLDCLSPLLYAAIFLFLQHHRQTNSGSNPAPNANLTRPSEPLD